MLRTLAVLLALAVAVFLLWPAPIDSRPFPTGPRPALEGALAPNRDLERCERISVGEIRHSDKLLVGPDGAIYAGDDAGTIFRLAPDGAGGYALERFAEMGGRPMELAFAPDGRIVVADHEGPHASIGPSGDVRRLPTLAGLEEGTAGVAVGSDGTLYYGAHTEPRISDDELTGALMSGLDMSGASELRAFDPVTGSERTLATGLYRPVGVELSANEDFVAVAEFFAYRITRHWLSGAKAGTTDRLVENLPGFPDGLGSDGRGRFLVGVAGLRTPPMDWLQVRPWAKNQAAKALMLLIRLGWEPPQGGPGLVIVLDEAGRILGSHHDPDGLRVSQVTAAEMHGGHLYLGSITSDWIARCPLRP